MNEQADTQADTLVDNKQYVLRLFVTGASLNSVRAITNLKKLCETHIPGNYSLEIIDVYQQRELAEQEQIEFSQRDLLILVLHLF